MVSHLRFPPGMAGGLLLAYPRMIKAGLLRRDEYMARSQRDLFSLVHARSHLIDSGEWYLGHGQALSIARVNEIHIPQLETWNGLCAHIIQVFLEIVGAAGHVKECQTTQLLARRGGVAGQRHFVYARAVGQFGKVQIFLDARQYEIAGPVDRAVPTGAGIREGNDPLHLRRIFAQQPDAHRNRPAFAVSWQHAVKRHAVEL